MTGVNQTILMCLSMVVIASLIGARGLGQEVLVALQFVAKGQGILAGLAILCCAMVLDRIVQGRFRREGGDMIDHRRKKTGSQKHCRRCATSGHCRFRQGFRHSARRLLCPCDDPDSIARGLCCDFQLGRGCFWPRVGGGARALGFFLVFCHFGTDGPGATEPGLFSDLGSATQGPERIGLEKTTKRMLARVQAARDRGDEAGADALARNAERLQAALEKVLDQADEAAAAGVELVIFGLFYLCSGQGHRRDKCQYRLRKALFEMARRQARVAGFQWTGAVIGAVFVAAVYSIALYGFTVAEPVAFVHTFPADKTHYQILAAAIDRVFDQTATDFGVFFNGIARSIRLTFRRAGGGLCPNAWPVVMVVITLFAWRLAGPRVAISPWPRLPISPFWDSGKRPWKRCRCWEPRPFSAWSLACHWASGSRGASGLMRLRGPFWI